MKIDSTTFGTITIDGKTYEHDVVVRLSGEVVKHGATQWYTDREDRAAALWEKAQQLLQFRQRRRALSRAPKNAAADQANARLKHQTRNPFDDPADGREPAERDRNCEHSPGNLNQCRSIAHQAITS